MKKNLLLTGLLVSSMAILPFATQAQISASKNEGQSESAVAVSRRSVFVPNQGQWPSEVLFYGRSGVADVWLTIRGLEFDIHRSEVTLPRSAEERYAFISENRTSKIRRVGHLVRLKAAGEHVSSVFGLNPDGSVRNYFLGKDRSKWATNVPAYEAVQLNEMFPGIDAVAQFENGLPRYDFIVKPGADPDDISLNFAGASGVSVDKSGEYITLHTTLGDVRSGRIVAYQEINGARLTIPCSFIAKAGTSKTVKFQIGKYNHSYPLVIDPLIYSTYLGESGIDKITEITTDKFDNIIAVGSTDAATYPVAIGAYDTTFNGGLDGFVTKFDPALSKIMFSTYIGGGADDQVNSVSLDDEQSIYIGGETTSASFPTIGGWKTIHAGAIDGFVAKISADGSQLNYGSFIGGGGNDRVLSVHSNQIGELVAGGETNSQNFSTGGASLYQKSRQGAFDGFLARFKPTGASVDFSTYFGGAGNDRISGVSHDAGSSNVYFGGECSDPLTTGTNTNGTFPVPTGGWGGCPSCKPYDNTFNNGIDGFVGCMTVTGGFSNQNTQYIGYLGSNLDDRVTGVVVGQDNSLIVTGSTQMGQSTKFPLQTAPGKGGFDVFVVRVKAGGRDLLLSTTFGGSGDDFGSAIVPVIDLLTGSAGDYYIAGTTLSANFPTLATAPIQSPIQPTFGGKSDMFVTRVSSTFSPIYSTYLGGKGDDAATSIVATDRADYYVAGITASDSIGAVPESYKRKLSGSTDGYIAKVVVTGHVALSSPTAGSAFCPGGSAPTNITWTRQDLDPSNVVKIYVTSDGGSTWKYIDSTDKTSYGWKIPASAIPSSNYRIRLLHYSGLKSESGNFTILGPASVAEHPQNDTLCPGSILRLQAKGAGSGKLTYQWKKNGTAINGARDSVYTIASVSPQDAAEYTVDVANLCFTAVSRGAKIVVKPATAITEQPKGRTIKEQESYTFTVKSAGLQTSYQWYKDGFKILNATESMYKIASASLGDAGSYTVAVTGECGTDSSQAAILIVEKANSVEESITAGLRPAIVAQISGNEISAAITPAAQGACEVSLIDNSGNTIAKSYFNGISSVMQTVVFDAASAASGIYWVVVTQNGITNTLKLPVVR